MSAMLARLKRIEAGRYRSAVQIIPPDRPPDHQPTEEERDALIAELEAMSRNPKAVIIIRRGARLDARRLSPHLLTGQGLERSYTGKP